MSAPQSAVSPSVTSPTTALPSRTTTMGTDDEDVVPGEDTSEVTKLFMERLQAWKHATGNLEDYIEATQKAHHQQGKEYEHVLKTVSKPLREGHHFDQQLGGIAGMFDNIRSNTQGMANSHQDTAKTLKGSILPVFERLHTEIMNKSKELTKGAGKGSKLVDKARNTTQKHIELLGQHTANFDSSGGKVNPSEDPYIIQRGIYHRLNKQVMEENNNRNDLLAVQNSFAQFEAHIISTLQTGLGQFMQVVNGQAEQQKTMYGDMVGTAQQVAPDFEWNGFVHRNNHVLIDPNAPPRSVSSLSFPNQNHHSTQALIAGSLERKGKLLKKYETAYYVVTPSKYLHEFKTDDDFAKDPQPENSLFLPDCVIGAVDGLKFNVKGKDVSKGAVGNKFSMSHEFAFKAHTAADAQQWWEVIGKAAGKVTQEAPNSALTSPITPTAGHADPFPVEGDAKHPAPLQTEGLAGEKVGTATPASATPATASSAAHQTEAVHHTEAAPGSAVSTTDHAPLSAAEKKV